MGPASKDASASRVLSRHVGGSNGLTSRCVEAEVPDSALGIEDHRNVAGIGLRARQRCRADVAPSSDAAHPVTTPEVGRRLHAQATRPWPSSQSMRFRLRACGTALEPGRAVPSRRRSRRAAAARCGRRGGHSAPGLLGVEEKALVQTGSGAVGEQLVDVADFALLRFLVLRVADEDTARAVPERQVGSR
jgi:hypothetical protein